MTRVSESVEQNIEVGRCINRHVNRKVGGSRIIYGRHIVCNVSRNTRPPLHLFRYLTSSSTRYGSSLRQRLPYKNIFIRPDDSWNLVENRRRLLLLASVLDLDLT